MSRYLGNFSAQNQLTLCLSYLETYQFSIPGNLLLSSTFALLFLPLSAILALEPSSLEEAGLAERSSYRSWVAYFQHLKLPLSIAPGTWSSFLLKLLCKSLLL